MQDRIEIFIAFIMRMEIQEGAGLMLIFFSMMSTTAASKVASEDEPGEKWDRCIADTVIKTGMEAIIASYRFNSN